VPTCPIWPPVLPLYLTYILIFLLQLLSEPALYRLLMLHVTNLMFIVLSSGHSPKKIHPSLRPCVTFCNKIIFCGQELLAPSHPPCRRTTTCRLSSTAYSIYSHLLSIPEGHLIQLHLLSWAWSHKTSFIASFCDHWVSKRIFSDLFFSITW
jgi:hypothetical protein